MAEMSTALRPELLLAGVKDEQMGLGHAYEIDPSIENSFLLELAQAQLIRQVFPRHPLKWMPPTKFKTGDILQSHVHDAMFNLVGVATNHDAQSASELLRHADLALYQAKADEKGTWQRYRSELHSAMVERLETRPAPGSPPA